MDRITVDDGTENFFVKILQDKIKEAKLLNESEEKFIEGYNYALELLDKFHYKIDDPNIVKFKIDEGEKEKELDLPKITIDKNKKYDGGRRHNW